MSRHLFIIGAQRSGTTYLWNILNAHPDVYMARPVRPEPKYFLDPINCAANYDAYRKAFFLAAGDVKWLGEKSTSYIECEKAALTIKQTISDATILVMVRDPVERAISHYNFTKDHGLEPYDIERAIREESLRKNTWQAAGTSVTPYAYIERGKYTQYLKLWEHLFGKNQLILLVAEQFFGNQPAISNLYLRLGIDPQFVPSSLTERVNAGSAGRAECKLSDQFKASLQAIFQPWNRELEKRYNLDLSCWERKA